MTSVAPETFPRAQRRVLVSYDLPTDPRADITPGARIIALGGQTMGTTWSVKAVESDGRDAVFLRHGIEACLDLVIRQMSNWERDSDISRFNAAAAATWHEMPDELFSVLDCAFELARATDGAYDPTVGRLVDAWGFGPASGKTMRPDSTTLAAARRCRGWDRVQLDPGTRRAFQPGGFAIDLSSIAKGFAVDLVTDYLVAMGVRHFLVEIGGELRGRGIKPDGMPWWVELERPPATADLPPTVVALHGLAVATAGDYRRYFELGARRYSHVMDPRTGEPVVGPLAAVSVIHRDCMRADALATALFVLGPDEGRAFAARRGIAALFTIRDGSRCHERMTPALTAMLDD
ncbi:MAG: FAD:protein FMN transferase [Alphaproteobacteria bacterium]